LAAEYDVLASHATLAAIVEARGKKSEACLHWQAAHALAKRLREIYYRGLCIINRCENLKGRLCDRVGSRMHRNTLKMLTRLECQLLPQKAGFEHGKSLNSL
jgi:hypothetical protein